MVLRTNFRLTLATLLIIGTTVSAATAAGDAVVGFPSVLETHHSAEDLSGRLVRDMAARPRASVSTAPTVTASFQGGVGGDRRGSYFPVVLSALVPGAGEIYLGYKWRGIALLAVEAGAWTGYFAKRSRGLDTRAEYEAFADAHWTTRDWIKNHPETYPLFPDFTIEQMDSVGRAIPSSGHIPWVSKEEDKQHYYENIGKYQWYLSGWDDYDPDVFPNMENTPRRDEYRALRRESNDRLDAANRFIYLSLATRVFSVMHTYLLVRSGAGGDADAAMPTNLNNRLAFRAGARGFTGGEVALEYWFK